MSLLQTTSIAGLAMILGLVQAPQEPLPVSKAKEASTSVQQKEQIVKQVDPITLKSWVTAYSSTHSQTDDTPRITASGEKVRDGIVAANFLPFGTKIKMPRLFGDKVFVVKDRMHRRKKKAIDVWMPTTERAINFGRHYAEIEIVSTPDSRFAPLRYY